MATSGLESDIYIGLYSLGFKLLPEGICHLHRSFCETSCPKADHHCGQVFLLSPFELLPIFLELFHRGYCFHIQVPFIYIFLIHP